MQSCRLLYKIKICKQRKYTCALVCIFRNAPQYGKASNDLIATYYDEIISCSSDVQPELKTFLDYQLH